MQNLVDHVLQPPVANYFRNSAQEYTILDFLTARSDPETLARIRRWNTEVPELAVDRDTFVALLAGRSGQLAPVTGGLAGSLALSGMASGS